MNQSTRKYCDLGDVEDYLGSAIPGERQAAVEKQIGAVSRMFDTMADRKLVVEELGSGDDYQTEYYDGPGALRMLIHDCHDIQSVQVEDQDADFTAYPKIAPHWKLIGSWPKGDQNVAVTANFGYFDEIPDDLRLACAIVVSGIYNSMLPEAGGKKSESIGNYSVTYADPESFADFNRSLDVVRAYRNITI